MKILLMLFIGVMSLNVVAKIHTELIDYKDGNITLQGYLAYDESIKEKRPGIIVVHEWYGLNDYAKRRAEQLAELGYIAFAADIYGNGILAKSPEEAGKLASEFYKDRSKFRSRVNAALDVLRESTHVDKQNIAAIGYCFGGSGVLELARSGAEIKGVVSFHGNLSTEKAEDAKNIKCKVLVLSGADDPNVPPEQIAGFEKEMNDAKVDWQMNIYSYALHGFTNPANKQSTSKSVGYNEKADKRSWEAMKIFFDEIFK